MTQFNKKDFTWDGMYLMYKGAFDGAKMMMDVNPKAHPSWKGKLKPAFVARFKYNKSDRASFTKFLIANFTCEEYFGHMEKTNMGPEEILETKGYVSKTTADILSRNGYLPTPESKKNMLSEIIRGEITW